MIKIEKPIHGTKLITVWFADEPISDEGIIQYKEARFDKNKEEDFLTLVSDLDESEEEIKARFSKGCKYKVNRAYREDIDFVIRDSHDIEDGMLETFLDFFEDFWKSKNTELSDRQSLMTEMQAYRRNGALTIAWAVVAGEIAVYHTHIYDDSNARLLHSASLFRLKAENEEKNKNIIGMANRALHYEEMKFFKAKGLHLYDWGGAGKGEDVASITEFKESFGGCPVTYYDSEQINGLKAEMVSSFSKFKHKFKG